MNLYLKSVGMIFSKEKFKKNADSKCKSLLSNDLDILDGKEVNLNGEIEYQSKNEEYVLYPVMHEWCNHKKDMIEQLNLF